MQKSFDSPLIPGTDYKAASYQFGRFQIERQFFRLQLQARLVIHKYSIKKFNDFLFHKGPRCIFDILVYNGYIIAPSRMFEHCFLTGA